MRSNQHSFRVIYGDTDAMGVVYYANYLRYFEAGRAEFLRAVGIDYHSEFEALGYALPVVDVTAKFRRPARFDDLLTLETGVSEVRFGSVSMVYRLFRDEELLATGETLHACLAANGRVTRFPPSVRAKLLDSDD